MADSDVWPSCLHGATLPDMDSDMGCTQTRLAGHAFRDLDVSPEGGCVYPQRQQARMELDLSMGRLRADASSCLPAEEMLEVARGAEVEGNCNVSGDDDVVYDEMLDFLPIAYNTFFSFDESSTRTPAWARASPATAVEFDATPLVEPLLAAATKQERHNRESGGGGGAVEGQVKGEASVRRTKAMSSVLKMIRSLDLLEEDEGQEEEGGLEEDRSGVEDGGARKASSVEGLDQVAAKVEAWTANHGQLIGE